MTSVTAARYDKVATAFSERVAAVPKDRWESPAPCEGWVARDVIRHLVEWLPAFFFEKWGVDAPTVPSVDDDPVGAWMAVDRAFRGALADPAIATNERDTPMGPHTFESALDMICTPDLLIHTWDLARAAGLDERLDPDEVHQMWLAMEPLGDALVASGHYKAPVPLAADADEQTKLLASTGRTP